MNADQTGNSGWKSLWLSNSNPLICVDLRSSAAFSFLRRCGRLSMSVDLRRPGWMMLLVLGCAAASLPQQPAFAQSAAPGGQQAQPLSQRGEKPNIVFMMADNLGYGEPGCYGGGILRGAGTPRIDGLAGSGL